MTQPPDWSGRTDAPQPTAGFPAEAYPYPAPYPPPYPYAYPPGPYPGSYPPPPIPYGDYPPVPVAVRNGLGVSALGVGVVALLLSFLIVPGILLGIVAVILGLIGRARVKRGEASNGSVALAGIVLGVTATIAGLAFIAIWAGLFNKVGASDYFDCLQQAGQDRAKVQLCSDEFRQSVENRFTVTATPRP